MSRLGYDDYSIGIICALPLELAAIISVLDEEHPNLPSSSRNEATYTLGRLAGHNVVIACLPAGRYGSSTAAITAMGMIGDFRRIVLGLLVGIGSGVPAQGNDIRLGDIVVSVPSGTHPGVVQYDFGKQNHDGFVPSGFLNRPPTIVLQALSRERADAARRDRDLKSIFGAIIAQHRKLRADFASPGPRQDRLFENSYIHVDGYQYCDSCSPEHEISRQERYDPDEPEVHYGLVASGNLVIKDGVIRDQVARQFGGVLCFEMEAAGIMNDLPAVVIRGISDYADSHRNHLWQGYAALMAAVYTKRLLGFITALKVVQQPNVADILDLDLSREPVTVRETLDLVDASDSVYMSGASSDTRVGEIEPTVLQAALDEIVFSMSNEKRFNSLCRAAILRMDLFVLERHIVAFLVSLRKSMRKTDNSFKKDLAKLLKNRQFDTARSICMQLGFLQETTFVERSHLDELDSARKDLLERYIRARSIGEVAPEDNMRVPNVVGYNDDDDDEAGPAIEDEEVDEDPPIEENLMALDKFSQALFDSPYDWYLTELENKIYPSAIEIIQKVLRRHWPRDQQTYSITCIIDWQFLDYLVSQNITFSQLESTFTITGKPDCCSVAPFGDYITSTWGRELLDILRRCFNRFQGPKDCSVASIPALESQTENAGSHNVDGCAMQLFYQDGSNCFTKSIVVTLSGSLGNVSKILEQFAWLSSTLREDHAMQLTVSEIQFQAVYAEVDGNVIESRELADRSSPPFTMRLRNQPTSLQANCKEPGQCWTQFLASSILAYGFPLPNSSRPLNALGLEIPFNIMAAFIGDIYPVMFDGRLAFANESTILVPQTFVENSIQWHIEDIQGIFRHVEESKDPIAPTDPTLEATDISTLIGCRAFVGHCTFAEVLLGTKDFLNINSPDSRVPPAGRVFKVKRDFNIGLGVSGQGFATAQSTGTMRYSPREVAQIEGNQLDIQSRIRRAKSTSIILYDQNMRIAFLVSELSVALQMSITYLRTNTGLEPATFPFASLQADGGQAAYEAITNAQDLDILNHIGKPEKLYDTVGRFLHIYEQRRTQRLLQRDDYWSISFSNELRGWDYADMQSEKYDFYGRGLKLKNPPIWWELSRSHKTLVLFTRMDQSVIRASPIAHDTSRCQAWDDYPVGLDIAVAPICQLLDLRGELCTPATTHQPRFMLNDKIFWARPLDTRLFDNATCHAGGTCNPVQAMLKRDQNDSRYRASPGPNLAPYGAVMFAQNPCGIPARPCILAAAATAVAAPVPPPPPFIAQDEPATPELDSAPKGLQHWSLWQIAQCIALAFVLARALASVGDVGMIAY